MKFKTVTFVSSILMSSLIAAEKTASTFDQGKVIPPGKYPAAYNASSQVKLENNKGEWIPDLFIDASFIYYHADQEGFDLATSGAVVEGVGGFIAVATSNSKTAFQKFQYKPGFKVGIGARFCEWTLASEYTWIRQTTTTSRLAPDPNLPGGIAVWMMNDWFQQLSPIGQSISASKINSKWHLGIDLGGLTLSRAYYQGSHLSVSPSFGLRAVWIRQNINVGIQIPTKILACQTSQKTFSKNSSQSWGIGPRAALEADCLLGKGFLFKGAVAGSLLFTQYIHITHKENVASVGAIPSNLQSQYTNYNCIRPIGELGLGMGWGSYFCSKKCHIDFSASYDFLVFWNQNMIRKLLDSVTEGVGATAGNLNLHGLTLTTRIDF